MPQVSSAAVTHPGLRREGNEDTFCTRPDLGLYLVADGMGGHAAGEVASRLAVDAIEAFVNDTRDADLNRTWPFPIDTSLSLDGNRMKAAFWLANQRIATRMAADLELRGMATTAAAILFGSGAPVVAHVGDSRVYLWREGQLRQLTDDHSWVNEQVRAGVLTDVDARRHPWRNVVTRALAGGEDPEVEIAELECLAGDRILLCSDGLSTVVSHQDIERIMGRGEEREAISQALVQAANDAGGPDNITVILIDVDVA